MPLSPGEKLGPYEILAPIGAGGMGEVYKARDTRLDRTVAVKVLPEHIAAREDARARFEREARAVASLNHPHICILHDIGPGYMVMELIEGETLAARIGKGALPLDQALEFATQIADALDRAHRAGVTHRDVKPQNIMLTRDGVKVLDFGLAKSAAAKPGPTDETLTKVLTTEGTVMGTPQYMAPELFEGKEADARADIWAFGAVLYEMVTGQKAFQGKSYSSLVGAILSADPVPMAVQPFTPSWLERLVRRCLAKDPEDRYHCMRDLVLDLRTPPLETAAAKASRWPWAVATVMALAAILGWGLWLLRKPNDAPHPVVRLEVSPPSGSRFASVVNIGGSAISPDGRTLAFVASPERGVLQLFIRQLDSLEARALPGTEDAGRPFWSPDSKSVAFVAGGKLKRVEAAGGIPQNLCDARAARGGTWSEEGVILFGDQLAGLQRIPASGGTPAPVTKLNREAGESAHYYPQFLPGGKKFLYFAGNPNPVKQGTFLGSLDGTPPILVEKTAHRSVYDSASGHLLYIQGEATLMAKKLALDSPAQAGAPVIVAEGMRLSGANRYTEVSVSRNGTLFYGRENSVEKIRFTWHDRAGKRLGAFGPLLDAGTLAFSLSPDGGRLAYSASAGAGRVDVWVLDQTRGSNTRITFNGASNSRWSADGKLVYFRNASGLYRKAADGSGEEEFLATTGASEPPSSVSPDGTWLLYGYGDIMVLPLTGKRKQEAYLQTKNVESGAVFSPDGRWVAYHSDESGRHEIYVQGFPDRRGKWMVSSEGGRFCKWRADGKELYWAGPNGILMAAGIELAANGVRVSPPQALFPLPAGLGLYFFESAPDGRRFLALEREGEPPVVPMVVVENWAAGLGK